MSTLLQTLQAKLQDPSIDWKNVLIGAVLGAAAFESLIVSRQRPYLSPILHPTLPAALQPHLPSTSSETYSKSQAYARAKLNFGAVINILDLVETGVLLTGLATPVAKALGFMGAGEGENWTLLKGFWDVSGLVPGVKGEITQSLAFTAIMTVLGAVLSIPKDLYKNFKLEQDHGFNKMTLGTFVKDTVKNLVVSLALELPILAGLIRIIHWAGQDAILRIVTWAIIFIFCIQLIMVPLFPAVIQPLFNKFTLLPEDSPVYPRVQALAKKLNFPLGKIWVIDGSVRSSHSNAYFYGLPGFNKNIVIYDTLLEKSKPEEIEAILAHELGHWKGNHIPVLLVTGLAQVALSLTTYTIFLTNRPLLSAFGFHAPSLSSKILDPSSAAVAQHGPTIIALLLAATLFTPLSTFLGFASNAITRRLEYDADAFAVQQGTETASNLKKALVTIHEKNLALYGVDWIYSSRHHSHPTLVERLEALDKGIEGKKEK
ncbi:hypothetical protein JCM8547_002452 [Rhodosporidiobolus lusitaniae]